MHGGDIYNNKVNIDYSVNINPLGIPLKVKEALTESLEDIVNYPEYGAGSLKAAIAKAEKCESERVVCGNGASELIMAVVNVIRPLRVLIPVPAFWGYERAVKALCPESDIKYISQFKEDDSVAGSEVPHMIREYKPELVFIATPGNPVGRLIEDNILKDIIKACEETGSFLVIDECFLPLTGKSYSLNLNDRVIVLKAFTKSYAMPGIRLGYCVCQDVAMANRLCEVLPEWNISVPAIKAGMAALSETEYMKESVELINKERKFLEEGLRGLGLETFDSDANYILFKVSEGAFSDAEGTESFSSFGDRLLERGILIRDCSDYKGLGRGYYRIAVKRHEDNVKLLDAIREILEGNI